MLENTLVSMISWMSMRMHSGLVLLLSLRLLLTILCAVLQSSGFYKNQTNLFSSSFYPPSFVEIVGCTNASQDFEKGGLPNKS